MKINTKDVFRRILTPYQILRIKDGLSIFKKSSIRENEKKRILEMQNFYGQYVKQGDLVFDVGANIGNRVSIFLDLNTKVLAVEPQKVCVKYLKHKFGKRIFIEAVGLGAFTEKQEMYISPSSTISSFSKDWIEKVSHSRFKDQKWDQKELVDITTLDNLIEKYGVPKFIKIDVEGYEFEVLKGLTQTINFISLEYCVPENQNLLIDCIKILNKLNQNYEFNYSIGESMKMKSSFWLSSNDFISLIKSSEFVKSGWGDVYARVNN